MSIVPGSSDFMRRLDPLDHYVMRDSEGRKTGVAFVTSAVPPEVGGYAGEIDVLVGLDMHGVVTGVAVLGHSETPEYFDRVVRSGLIDRFVGRDAAEGFEDIDAVTGATATSQAIIADISTASEKILHKILGKTSGRSLSLESLRVRQWARGLGAVVMAALATACAFMPRRRRLRAATLALAVLVVGAWLNSPITIGSIVDLRHFGLPWAWNLPLALLMIFAALAALFKGNLYCAYVCPFGALQEGAARILPFKVSPGGGVEKSLRWLRWIVAILAVYYISVAGSLAMRSVEPFATIFMRYPDTVAIVHASAVLAAALLVRRVWCRFLCPTGLMIDILAELGGKLRHSIRRRLRRRDEKIKDQ